ncbi:MAG: ribose-phosphate pyrophosphokinase [Alphaproteobacteria bacterium]
MTAPLLLAMPGSEALTQLLLDKIGAEQGEMQNRRFPDEETYLRIATDVSGRDVVMVCSLDRPDAKFLPLVYAVNLARDLGARSVGLVAPYLSYMRQDRRFQPGEAVTSGYFAKILSREIDWLVTVDPHLHRRTSLAEIYDIPTAVLHAAPLLSAWIGKEIERPLLVGPDGESEQWVAEVARDAGAPHVVLTKIRHGDRDVEISVPDVTRWHDRTPVLVDDIISTGRTMIETVGHLRKAGMQPSMCIAVHGIFAGSAYDDLIAAGAADIVTTNTVPHASNRIDVSQLLAGSIGEILERPVA